MHLFLVSRILVAQLGFKVWGGGLIAIMSENIMVFFFFNEKILMVRLR